MSKAELNPLARFTDRVGDYVRYRPGYPQALIDFLRANAGLRAGVAVADIGSGTGIFTRSLLEAGARVFAVEPNDAMRGAAEAEFSGRSGFVSVRGTSEATGLGAASVALITCAQAFHWFEPAPTRAEFARILAPGGRCAIVWNTQIWRGSRFGEGYEEIKARFGTDFGRIRHENVRGAAMFDSFFGPGGWVRHSFEYCQVLDREGLKGRMLSSSYAPKKGDPAHEPMLAALDQLFDRCQTGGTVRMEYETELFLGGNSWNTGGADPVPV